MSDIQYTFGAVVAVSLELLEIFKFILPPDEQPVIVTPEIVSVYGAFAVVPVVAVPKFWAVLKEGSSVVDEHPVAICMVIVWLPVVFAPWVK